MSSLISKLVKVTLLCTVLSFITCTKVNGQNSTGSDSTLSFSPKKYDSPNILEKSLYLTGASVLFAGVDYIGFNLTRDKPTYRLIYRVIQVAVQSAITWFLYEKLGLPTAIGFNLIWWTFGDDFIFYGYTELFNVGGDWYGRGILSEHILKNRVDWAYWTPLGIMRGMKRNQPIAGDALLAQSIIGACLAFTITIEF